MKQLIFGLFFLFSELLTFSQSLHFGVFGGTSHYQGDLVDKPYASRFTKPAIGITATYELTDRLNIRSGLTFARVEGNDKYNTKTYLQQRNLNFQSSISEFSLLGEFNIFSLEVTRWTPYIFGGAAIYRFNPYTNDENNAKVFLKPLSTEGQGLEQYPNNKPYSLTQVALPFGGGVKYAISDRVKVGIEVGIRKLFTDYLDDVSTNYADPADLLAAKGQQAVNLSYRGDEVQGGNPVYPVKGAQRGGAEQKDWYYFSGLHFTFRLGNGSGFGGRAGKNSYGCPTVKL